MSQRRAQLRELRDKLREVRADLKTEERQHAESMDRYHRLERELLHMISTTENLPTSEPPDNVPTDNPG